MNFKRTLLSAAVVLGGSAVLAGGAQAATSSISEAGSTLVYPLVQDWSTNFGILTGDTVTSQAVGSGTGIEDVCTGLDDIGASDAPLGYPGVKICQASGGTATTQSMSYAANYVEVPWALSATGIIYRIPVSGGHYITNGLHLTAADLVGIYTGSITKWSQLQSQQYTTKTKTVTKKVHGKKKKVKEKVKVALFKYKLPSTSITPVYRSDGSGDSYAFTNFMSKASSKWNNAYGPTTSFPTGADANALGASGNAGVAGDVENTAGAIGYVSNYYSIEVLNSGNGVGIAEVGNAAGNFEFPNVANIDDAASSIGSPPAQNTGSSSKFFGMAIQYPAKKYSAAYPISTYTYAIVPKNSGSNAAAVKAFLTFAVSKSYDGSTGGLNVGTTIGFAPLTSAIQSYDKKVINTISGS